MLTGKQILIVSNEPWSQMWFSKHHYAFQLSLKNEVYFVNPSPDWSLRRLLRIKVKIRRERESLSVLSYSNPLPLTGTFHLFFRLNEYLVCRTISKILQREGVKEPVFWTFDPFRFHNPSMLSAGLSIFHIVDNYQYTRRKAKMIKRMNALLFVSSKLGEKYHHLGIPSMVIPHGIGDHGYSFDHIVSASTRNIILLTGSVGPRIDFEVLLELSKRHPDYILRIIGPIVMKNASQEQRKKLEHLKAMSNVEFLGVLPYDDLHEHILESRLCVAAYLYTGGFLNLNSHKVAHYLSFGKDCVTSYFRDFEEAIAGNSNMMRITKSGDDFLKNCAEVLASDGPSKEQIRIRIEFAEQFQYPKLLKRIDSFLESNI